MAKTGLIKYLSILATAILWVIMIIFLISCITPFVNPNSAPWIGFSGLLAPYLFLIILFSIIFFLITHPKKALIPFFVLLLGIQQISVMFGLDLLSANAETKSNTNNIRLVNWNIRSFNGISDNKQIKKHIKVDIEQSILKLDPDIICLQEFNHSVSNKTYTKDELFNNYPFYYFSHDYKRKKGSYQSGCVIFSKYRIVDSGRIKFPLAESIIYVDVLKGKDTFRVYTTHLQSFKFKKEDYEEIDKIQQQDIETLNASKSLIRKMKIAFKLRGKQTDIVKKEIEKSPYPTLLCGDLNDVPNSYTYFQIRGNKQDAFLSKDLGIGKTFLSIAPTLRIDYIFPDNFFDIHQFDLVDEGLSDHIMLVADLSLKK